MSLIFYHAPMSTSSITEAVIAELAIPHERVLLDIGRGDTRTSDYRSVNPNGRVPAIVHDGTAIWESAAITMYLGEVFGVERNLYPELGLKRGEAMKWIIWGNVTLAEAAGRFSAALPAGSPGAVQSGSVDYVAPELRDPQLMDKSLADVVRCLSIFNTALFENPTC